MDLKSVPHNIVDYNIMEIQCGSKSLDQLYCSALSLKRNYRHSKGHNFFTLACLTLKVRALWPFETSTTASRRYGLRSQNIRVVRFTMQPILGSCECDSVLAMVLICKKDSAPCIFSVLHHHQFLLSLRGIGRQHNVVVWSCLRPSS